MDRKESGPQRVIITGFDISFKDWVLLLAQIAIAAIPAAIIIALIGVIASGAIML